MKKLDIEKVIREYSFPKRLRAGKTKVARALVKKSFRKGNILLVGLGGTISSGYTPTRETIVPLSPSPAVKQIEYINLFGVSKLSYDRIDLLAKDSRLITNADVALLLDVLNLSPQHKVLITAGTYMLPKIALCVLRACQNLSKRVALTGSILPAGFVASEADANIWSALSILNYASVHVMPKKCGVMLVFHGRVFETVEEIRKLNLHPKGMQKLIIQYPLTTVPVDGVL